MSEESTTPDLVELTSRQLEAANRGDLDAFMSVFALDALYDASGDGLGVYKATLAQGEVSVRMGTPVIDGDHVAAEFWVTATKGNEDAAIAGCFIARLDETNGLRTYFREYWFDMDGRIDAYKGWGD
jgi:hypothetical protein